MMDYRNNKYIDTLVSVSNNYSYKEGTFLITGATGLIGSFLADSLIVANRELGTNYKIYVLGRNEKTLNARFSYGEKYGIKYIIQNITNAISEKEDFNYIIHAASNADPVAYSTYPAETILTNIEGTKSVLEYCKNHYDTKVVLTSTFEVYGKIAGIDEYSEEMSGTIDLGRLRNLYPESKRCAEMLLRSYVDEYSVCGMIARLSSVYGPSMKDNDSKAHAQFIRNGLAHKDIVLKSAGLQKRSYTYVADTVSGIMHILSHGIEGQAYNVSNEKSIASIADVAATVAKIAGTKVVFDLPDEAEKKGFSSPQNCILNNKKIKSLGWDGEYTLEDGLRESMEILSGGRYV